MQIKKIILAFILCTHVVQAQDVVFSSEIIAFNKDFKKYYPHPQWVVKEYFLKMEAQDVVLAFEYLTLFVSDALERWFYLYDHPDSFKDDIYDANELIKHFDQYNYYFERMAINQVDGTIELLKDKIYHESSFESKGKIYIPLFSLLKAGGVESFSRFYATYFKYLSRIFVDECKTLSVKRTANAWYELYLLLEKMNGSYAHLKGSEFEKTAELLLMKYSYIVYELWAKRA